MVYAKQTLEDGTEVYPVFAGMVVVRLSDGRRWTIKFPPNMSDLELIRVHVEGEGLLSVWSNPEGNDMICHPDGHWQPMVNAAYAVPRNLQVVSFVRHRPDGTPLATVTFSIAHGFCKGCGMCAGACQHDGLGFLEQVDGHGFHQAILKRPENCRACADCALMCPEGAIMITMRQHGKEVPSGDVDQAVSV